MAEIKALSRIQEKWTRVTPARSEDYKIGVGQPRRDWEKASRAAKEAHKAAMVAAAALDSYDKGVAKAGTPKWQNRATTKGPGRFAEGVMVAGEDYGKGYSPYHDEYTKLILPPRFPRRDPRNLQRVGAIDVAFAKKKTG